MSSEITQDEAIYYLVFSVAAADHATGFLQQTVSDEEWNYLEQLKGRDNLELSDAVQIKKSWGTVDALVFHGHRTNTFEKHREGADQNAWDACCEVLKNASKAGIFKTIADMILISHMSDEDKDGLATSNREAELINQTAFKLGVTEEELNSIKHIVDSESVVSEVPAAAERLGIEAEEKAVLLEKSGISGIQLLDELVALNSVGEKTAAAVVKHFGNSAAISMASQEDLEEIDSVSYRNALVIKERFN